MCRRIFKEQTSENGEIPFYKIGTFGGEADAFISRELFEEYKAKYQYPKKGDILISASGSIGRTVVFTGKNEYFQDSNIVWLNHDKHLDNSFLKCFYSIVKWAGIEGSTIKRLYNDNILNTAITLPSVEEQQKIGAYFENLDNLITLHQCKCQIDGCRFQSPLAITWEQRKLGEIITEYKETVDSDCTLPILTSSKTEGVILQEEHFGRKQQHDITGYNILPRNYCTYRNRSDGVDFTFNINICCDKGIISKFYPVFSGKNSDVFFLSLVLNNSEEVVHEIAYTCTGTGQKVLSFLDLQKMKVRVPNFDEQKEIAAYFESLDHLITLHQCE